MGQFGDQAYEPSADELIDVLKNLENLAAANPGLYRTIVEQIKGKVSKLLVQSLKVLQRFQNLKFWSLKALLKKHVTDDRCTLMFESDILYFLSIDILLPKDS